MKKVHVQQTPKQISVFEYVAFNNPAAAHQILLSFGKEGVARKRSAIATELSQLFKEQGIPVMEKVFEAHPDKVMFEEIFAKNEDIKSEPVEVLKKEAEETKPAGKFVSACGCGIGFDGFVNCEGKTGCNCHKKAKTEQEFTNAEGDSKAKDKPKEETKLPEKQTVFTPINMALGAVVFISVVALITTKKG